MSQIVFHAANERGLADHGWLVARFSFSFGGHQDPEKVHFGALRVLNDDVIGTEVGFPEHPHSNMEIITVVLEGALSHKDSMGNGAAITPNEVQVMSAGSGLYHSEYNASSTEKIKSLQIWIFPKEKNIAPRYEQKAFDPRERLNKLQTLVGPMGNNEKDALEINQDAYIYRSTLEAGKSITHHLKDKNNGVYAFLLSGQIQAKGQVLNTRDAVGIWDAETITYTASADSDLLLLEVPMEF